MLWKMTRNILLVGVVLAVAVFLSSGSLDKWQEVKDRISAAGGKLNNQNEQQVITPAPPEVPIEAQTPETKEVMLYFSDAKGTQLVAEKREIEKVEGIAKATLQALIDGPAGKSENYPVIPLGTRVLGISIKEDGLCIVDFSEEFISNFEGDANAERMTVYSVVNTLTQFPTVQRVKILVNGYEHDTLAGNESISGELMRDDSVIDSVQ